MLKPVLITNNPSGFNTYSCPRSYTQVITGVLVFPTSYVVPCQISAFILVRNDSSGTCFVSVSIPTAPANNSTVLPESVFASLPSRANQTAALGELYHLPRAGSRGNLSCAPPIQYLRVLRLLLRSPHRVQLGNQGIIVKTARLVVPTRHGAVGSAIRLARRK
jgi:hypothetical protein